MELLDLMLKRRSIRSYTNDEIPDETIEKIVSAGLIAPTSRNRKPCELIVVKNKELLNKLSKSKTAGSAMLKDANCAIVVTADSKKADTWIEDASIALTYMDLMAVNEEIGSCWVQSHLRSNENEESEEYIRKLFNLDDNYRIVGILSLGITDKKLDSHTLDEIDKNKSRYE